MIEVVFFEAPRALERMLGTQIPPETVREGVMIPKKTLEKLLRQANHHKDYRSLVGQFDSEAGEELAKSEQAAALVAQVRSMVVPSAPAATTIGARRRGRPNSK
jgi:hypothetical protein